MNEPNTIERTSRRVIERKLLEALSDESKVAILATEQDLRDMIHALECWQCVNNSAGWRRRNDLLAGMNQLLREAFPIKETQP
jgi:hypothetical protein